MKILSSIALCSMVSCAYATPYAQLHDVDGHQQIIITHLPIVKTPIKQELLHHSLLTPSVTELPINTIKHDPIVPITIKKSTPHTSTPIATIKPTVTPTVIVQPQFYVTQGQTYMTAIRQWLANDKLTKVAWSIPAETVKALNKTSVNGALFKGNIENVIKQLGDKLEQPLYFSKNTKGLAAIHNIKGSVDIRWIHGSTLKDAIHNLTTEYQWQWLQGKNGSWMAPDNYDFIAPYPIAIPRGNFADALNTVLDGYPVQAQLLYATKNIFIVEKE